MNTEHQIPNTEYRTPEVFLVGAGPGHPGLLTLRAAECLAQADVVLYDKLVPIGLLRHTPAAAKRICITELEAPHGERYKPIMATLLREAQAGKRVVRLKGGDPLIFGRGGEELEFLRDHGISYEIVPGVTSALGSSACAGIPLTHRDYASGVVFVTGHENPAKKEATVDWQLLAKFSGTIVVYMGLSRLPQIAEALIAHGKEATTPAAVIHWGTTGYQRTITAPLAELAQQAQKAGVISPALIVIGAVAGLREKLQWFENRPLFGRRVLITRPKDQAWDLAQRVEALGGIPFLLPVVDVQPLEDWSEVDKVIAEIDRFDWLGFTSANGVRAFLNRLLETGRDLRALGPLKLAAIGPKTAEVLQSFHLRADIVPEVYRSEEFASALSSAVRGKRVLLARADRGRDVLPRELAKVANVRQIAVYRQVDADFEDCDELDRLRRGEIDFVTLTSPSIARALLARLDEFCKKRIEKGDVQLVAISPVTGAEVRQAGLPLAGEAGEFTTDGLLNELIRLAQIAGRVPREIENDPAGDDADDIHIRADSAEGEPQNQIQQK